MDVATDRDARDATDVSHECVPRGMWGDIGAGVKRCLRIAGRNRSARCSDDWDERQVRFELITFGAGANQGHDGHDCKFRVHGVSEACKIVILALFPRDVQARSLVVGGKLGSRDVGYLIPKVGLLEERPAVSGGVREDATKTVAMSCGEQHSWRSCYPDHDGFGKRRTVV